MKTKVLAPFVLPRNNWSFDSGKTNGVMPAVYEKAKVKKKIFILFIPMNRESLVDAGG